MPERCEVYVCAHLSIKGPKCFKIELVTVIHSQRFGTPKWEIMFCQQNFLIVAEVIVDNAFASIHLEKYSTATMAYFKFPCAVGIGPIMSIPHLYKGQVGCIDWIKDEGFFISCTPFTIVTLPDKLCYVRSYIQPVETLTKDFP